MASYFAKSIIAGKDYKSIFKVSVYKRYQAETDTILTKMGYQHLINK